MPLAASEFVALLVAEVPETTGMLNEHLADQEGELLLHLFVGDLRLLSIDWFRTGQTAAVVRILSALERGLREGDEYVENAVGVSFVEDLGWWEPDMQPFIENLPGELAKEIETLRRWNG